MMSLINLKIAKFCLAFLCLMHISNSVASGFKDGCEKGALNTSQLAAKMNKLFLEIIEKTAPNSKDRQAANAIMSEFQDKFYEQKRKMERDMTARLVDMSAPASERIRTLNYIETYATAYEAASNIAIQIAAQDAIAGIANSDPNFFRRRAERLCAEGFSR